ncbi:TetR/AcrR family transcriptional regulator [Micromonospora vulcania]
MSSSAIGRKGAATRQRIVAGAALLIRDRGAAQTSLDDVLEATSTSKGQLFHYFPQGRAGLLSAVAEHEVTQVLEAQQPYLSDLSTLEPWERWREAVLTHYLELGDKCPLGALTTELGKTSPETRAIVSRLYGTWEASLALGVARLRERGAVAGAIDPDHLARCVLVAIQGA